jgi:rare lipoprotein A (peptidoglycan hydrolase)
VKRLLSVAAPVLAVAAVLPAGKTHPRCPRTFTARMGERAGRVIYRGTRTVTRRNLRLLGRLEMCQRSRLGRRTVRVYDHLEAALHARRVYDRAHPYSEAVASWYYAAGGPIACAGYSSYAMGVANRTLPCGTPVEICYASCVNAIVFDRGPFVAGRDWDLSEAVKNATGFPDGVATVRYRLGSR